MVFSNILILVLDLLFSHYPPNYNLSVAGIYFSCLLHNLEFRLCFYPCPNGWAGGLRERKKHCLRLKQVLGERVGGGKSVHEFLSYGSRFPGCR